MKHFSVEVVHTVYPLHKFFVSFVGAPEKVGWGEVVEVMEKGELSALRRREGGDVSRSSTVKPRYNAGRGRKNFEAKNRVILIARSAL